MFLIKITVLFDSGIKKVYKQREKRVSKEEAMGIINKYNKELQSVYNEGLHGHISIFLTNEETVVIDLYKTSSITFSLYK
jgi:hypothetical protein